MKKIYFLIQFSVLLVLMPSLAGGATIRDRLIDGLGNPLSANVTAYNPGTNVVNGTARTNQTGDYNLTLATGIYDIKYSFEDFFLTNFFIKLNSFNVSSDIRNLLNVSNTTDKIIIFVNDTNPLDVEVFSKEEPTNISIDGFILSEVQSISNLNDGKWFFDSTGSEIRMKYSTQIPPTTTTTTSTSTTTTLPSDSRTFYAGIQPVTLENETRKGAVNDQVNLEAILDFGANLVPWFLAHHSLNNVELYEVSGQTLHTYGQGIEIWSTPGQGYWRISINDSFTEGGVNYGVRRGDVIELNAQSPKASWLNRSYGISLTGVNIQMNRYNIPVSVKLYRGATTYNGYGVYRHVWGKFTQYPVVMVNWTYLYIYTDRFYVDIEEALDGGPYQDGGILFFDDMYYDVIGSSVYGYSYSVTDGPNCDNFTINVDTHRGPLTIKLLGLSRLAGPGCYFQTPMFTDVEVSGAMNFRGYAALGETARRQAPH